MELNIRFGTVQKTSVLSVTLEPCLCRCSAMSTGSNAAWESPAKTPQLQNRYRGDVKTLKWWNPIRVLALNLFNLVWGTKGNVSSDKAPQDPSVHQLDVSLHGVPRRDVWRHECQSCWKSRERGREKGESKEGNYSFAYLDVASFIEGPAKVIPNYPGPGDKGGSF